MEMPADDYILISLVNTALRDKYPALEDFLSEEDNAAEIVARLAKIGLTYDKTANRFK